MSKYFCQNEVDYHNGKRCKRACNMCLELNGEYYNLKEESKHEDDE